MNCLEMAQLCDLDIGFSPQFTPDETANATNGRPFFDNVRPSNKLDKHGNPLLAIKERGEITRKKIRGRSREKNCSSRKISGVGRRTQEDRGAADRPGEKITKKSPERIK